MVCRPLHLTLALWLGLGGVTGSSAQTAAHAGVALPRFRIRHWTSDEGLPQNRIACLAQSRDGYLWIGTWFGLARFDGLHFTVFNQRNTPALTNQTINALAEDRNGTLWIGTDDGLVSYRDHQFHRLTTADGLPRRQIWRLASAQSGGVWVESGRFVARFDNGKFSRWWLGHFALGDDIVSLSEGADGWLNVVSRRGWFQISPNGGEMRTNEFHSDLTHGWHASASAPEQDGVWVAPDTGLVLLRRGAKPKAVPEFAGQRVNYLLQDRSHGFWAETGSGKLYHQDDGAWHQCEIGRDQTPIKLVCMVQDRAGDLWLGTEQGLFLWQRQFARTYATHVSTALDDVWAVCQGTDGRVWASSDGGLWCVTNGRVEMPKVHEPDLGNRDLSICPGPNGSIWFDKEAIGLMQYDRQQFVRRLRVRSAPGACPLYVDRARRLWVGGGNGAVAYKPNQFATPVISLTNDDLRGVSCIFEASDGTFWIGVWRRGVRHVSGGRVSSFTTQDGLSDNSVGTICQDRQGTLWLGTEHGLTRLRDGKVFAFRRTSGVPQGPINCVLMDDFGNLWLSGLKGIYRVALKELNAVAEDRAKSVQCLRLDTFDGMESAESNGDRGSSGWKARDGRLWFPTGRGLVVIDPKEIKANEDVLTNGPPVAIELVKANGKVVFGGASSPSRASVSLRRADETAALRIPAGRSHVIEFRFAAMDFSAPNQTRFRYRLIGDSPNWSEETGERVVPYADLQPGTYRFEVTAANHHEIWNPHPAMMAFIIAPYFWQTSWFYVLCVCAVIVLVAAIQAYRLKWQRRVLKLEEQQSLANERTRIARDLHDDLGTALTGLALELDVLGRDGPAGKSARAATLSQAAQHTRNLAERMREVVWAVNPRCDTVPSVASFLEQQAAQLLGAAGLNVRLDFPEVLPDLPMNSLQRHQLALCVREAFNNIVRHAQATVANIRLELTDHKLFIRIQDNGCGFESEKGCEHEHGLENMRVRIGKIGGIFQCDSQPGKGTIVTFVVPAGPDEN